MKMLKNYLLIKPIDKVSDSKIVLPQSVKGEWNRGKVIETGLGDFDTKGNRIVMEVKVGDIVIFPQTNFPELTINKDKYIILTEKCLWAIE